MVNPAHMQRTQILKKIRTSEKLICTCSNIVSISAVKLLVLSWNLEMVPNNHGVNQSLLACHSRILPWFFDKDKADFLRGVIMLDSFVSSRLGGKYNSFPNVTLISYSISAFKNRFWTSIFSNFWHKVLGTIWKFDPMSKDHWRLSCSCSVFKALVCSTYFPLCSFHM